MSPFVEPTAAEQSDYTAYLDSMRDQGILLNGFLTKLLPYWVEPGLEALQAPPASEIEAETQDRTYGWGSLRPRPLDPRRPVPVVYGEVFLRQLTLINFHVVPVGNSQRLRMLFALGRGEFEEIATLTADTDNVEGDDLDAIGSNLLINGVPAKNFENLRMSVRKGTRDQKYMRGFLNTHNSNDDARFPISMEPREWYEVEPDGETQSVKLHFLVSELWNVVNGDYQAGTIEIKVQYESRGNNPHWRDAGTLTITENVQSGADILRTHKIEFPSTGAWKVRAKKLTPASVEDVSANDVVWNILDEITEGKETYPGVALLAIKVLDQEELFGNIPQVEVKVKGRKVLRAPRFDSPNASLDLDDTYYDDAAGTYKKISDNTDVAWSSPYYIRKQYTRNPLWCLLDFILDPVFGSGKDIAVADMDMDMLRESAAYAHEMVKKYLDSEEDDTEHRNRLDIYLDRQMQMRDHITRIMKGFRGFYVWSGGQLLLRIDKDDSVTPAAPLFGDGNVIQGSFTENFVPLNAVANRIQSSYIDEDKDYNENEVIITTDDGRMELVKSHYFSGVNRRSQVTRISKHLLEVESNIMRRISFDTAIDAVLVRAGDLIYFANHTPAWGAASGRILSGTSTTFTMNRDVTIAADAVVYTRAPDDTFEAHDITTTGLVESGGTITIDDTFTTTPAAYDIVIIGAPKPFRVVSIEIDVDYTTTIEAVEFVDVYNDSINENDIIDYSNLPRPVLLPSVVSNFRARNSLSAADTAVHLTWKNPPVEETAPLFAPLGHVDILIADDQQIFKVIGTSEGESFVVGNLIGGQEYIFMIVSVSKAGYKTPQASSPTTSIQVNITDFPPNIDGLELRGQGNDREFIGRDPVFQWNEPSTAVQGGLIGPRGAGNVSGDVQIVGYQVEIFESLVADPVRTEPSVTMPEYTYSYEKNVADNGTPLREFSIRVRAINLAGQYSVQGKTLTVINPRSDAPTGVTTTSAYRSIKVAWNKNAEIDHAGYVVRRSTSPGVGTTQEKWVAKDVVYVGPNNDYTEADITINEDFYYQIAAYDTFDPIVDATSVAAINLLTATVETGADSANGIDQTDITEFYTDAADAFTRVPVLQGDTWYSNTPDLGKVSWDSFFIYYSQVAGATVEYAITSGETPAAGQGGNPNEYFIYWLIGDTAMTVSAEHPANPAYGDNWADGDAVPASLFHIAMDAGSAWSDLTSYVEGDIVSQSGVTYLCTAANLDQVPPNGLYWSVKTVYPSPGGFLIAWNRNGIALPAYQSIANLVVGSANMLLAFIIDAHIQSLNADKITAGTINTQLLEIGNRELQFDDLFFAVDEDVAPSQITWTEGTISYHDTDIGGDKVYVTISIPASVSAVTWTTGFKYFYFSKPATGVFTGTIQSTDDIAVASAFDNAICAVYSGLGTLIISRGGTEISGNMIKTGTLDADLVNVVHLKTHTLEVESAVLWDTDDTYQILALVNHPHPDDGPTYVSKHSGNKGNTPVGGGGDAHWTKRLVPGGNFDPNLIYPGTLLVGGAFDNIIIEDATVAKVFDGVPERFEDEYEAAFRKDDHADILYYVFTFDYSLWDTNQRVDWFIDVKTSFGYLNKATGFVDPPALTSPSNKYQDSIVLTDDIDLPSSLFPSGAGLIRLRLEMADAGVNGGYAWIKNLTLKTQTILTNVHAL